MISRTALSQVLNPINFFTTIKYNRKFYKEHPTYFIPDGFTCFVGTQGSGKTLSAVNYVYELLKMYPKCLLVSNVSLKDYPIDNERIFKFEEGNDVIKYKNGIEGVIFLIDEIHLYFGSQKGNNNLDPAVLQQICQQRKQRIHIVSTTQYFGQLNIALRRHFDSIVLCKNTIIPHLQCNNLLQKSSLSTDDSSGQILCGEVLQKIFFFRSPKMFLRYDTLAVIENKNLSATYRKEEINYGS